MNILYYDCFSGISGDMNMAALIDLGVDPQYLRSELSKLKLSGYELKISRDVRHAISGTRVDVVLLENHQKAHNHSHGHQQGQEQEHVHIHEPSGDHDPSDKSNHGHVHRNLDDIRTIVNKSGLNELVKNLSVRMFEVIAKAEARVHGTSIERIHFHEVGAVDSIVDIVGAAICLDYLQVDRVMASTVEVGGGFVRCAHGTMPVPAPATAEILKGAPVRMGTVSQETTTPTGAAILASNVDEFTDHKQMSIRKIGYGIGHKKFEIPNILRVYLGSEVEPGPGKGYQTNKAVEISSNIDDMNPEYYEHVMNQLFDAGADEVYITPVIMKKTRPANLLSVLCREEKEEEISRVLFRHTSTLGLRRKSVDKSELERREETKQTRFGQVSVKTAYLDGKLLKYKPEYDDCKGIAREHNKSIQEVYRNIMEDIAPNRE